MLTEYIEATRNPVYEHLDMARRYRIERAHNDAFGEAMSGEGDFWKDCHASIYDAVREAMSDATMSADYFRATVRMAVRLEAEKYAAAIAKDVD